MPTRNSNEFHFRIDYSTLIFLFTHMTVLWKLNELLPRAMWQAKMDTFLLSPIINMCMRNWVSEDTSWQVLQQIPGSAGMTVKILFVSVHDLYWIEHIQIETLISKEDPFWGEYENECDEFTQMIRYRVLQTRLNKP